MIRCRARALQPFSGLLTRGTRPFSGQNRPRAESSRRTRAKDPKGRASRSKSQRETAQWRDDDHDSRNFWGLRPGVDQKFREDALAVNKTLKWHRKESQFSGEVGDSFLEPSRETGRNRWWDSWEAEWDDGWDWEEKWQSRLGTPAAPTEVGKDNPRRPKGPMWLQDGNYRPVPSLNHSQLAAAIVDAHKQVDELHWQALCRRAELVAMSMTPAELLAVARCVAERQSGQLRLLWKIATFMVERLGSFTTTDLVCMAHVYSSLDAVHHGMLNVVALILASPEDERTMDATLAVDVLESFARAQYPLPLLVNEVRRVLLQCDASELKPTMALSALDSFSKLKCLDEEVLGCLLPCVISTVPAAESLAQICAAASWGCRQKPEVRTKFQEQSQEEANMANMARTKDLTETQPLMSVSQAQNAILSTLVERLQHCRWQQLQVVRHKAQPSLGWKREAASSQSPLCVVPTSGQMGSVKGDLLLAAAQLLAGQQPDMCIKGTKLAGQILVAAVGTSSKLALWSPEQRAQWLTVAADIAQICPSISSELPATLIPAMLESISSVEAAKLTMVSPGVADVLPRILASYGQPVVSEASKTVRLLCDAVRPELYRLRLQETYRVLQGSFESQALLLGFEGDSAVEVELSFCALLTAILDSLPAKFKSESVFHRKGVSQSGMELAAWCSLLAKIPSASSASARPNHDVAPRLPVPEAIWKLLAVECQDALAASGLGQEQGEISGAAVARQILDSFLKVKDVYHWRILDQESPLGIVALAVQTQWKRAIARDGELEDPLHEPPPIPSEDARCLKHLFEESGIELPTDVRI
eukprot:s276_g20.t1